MTAAHDLIVIGGGLSGGLPAAAYLQKYGLDVLIVEANSELGSFCCTHETWAQTFDSPHVGVSFAGNSPVIEDLGLEDYGFRFAVSPVILATTFRDGTNCLICRSRRGRPRTSRSTRSATASGCSASRSASTRRWSSSTNCARSVRTPIRRSSTASSRSARTRWTSASRRCRR